MRQLHRRSLLPQRPVLVSVLLLSASLYVGCATSLPTTTSPQSPPDESTPSSPLGTPEVESEEAQPSVLDPRRSTTAGESFPIARETALAWEQEAEWYGIVPFTSMARATVIPLSDENPSWFFRFAVEGGEREYLVEVRNGEVIGTNELRIPAYIEPPISELEALGQTSDIVDSVVVLSTYLDNRGGLPGVVDYRLTHPTDQLHPIWTLYDAHDLSEPLLVVDARTGKAVTSQ